VSIEIAAEARWPKETTGGVLSDGAIMREIESGGLIVSGFEDASLHPASYDLMIAPDALIMPSGRKIEPGKCGRRHRTVVLDPGETALFSTKELFRMPPDIAGNISIKNQFAAEGLTLLSGMLVDPGYGLEERADDELGCRLFMHVANMGRKAIALRPDKDKIARIQFLTVVGDKWKERNTPRASRWSEQQQASLGFLADLKQLKDDVERSDNRSRQVVLFGTVVLAIALIGATLSAILSIATNSQLSKELHHAWPASSRDGLVWALVFVGITFGAMTIASTADKICRALGARRQRRRRNY
jgi:deoxycytidine triphosphate deaminase